jgi:hypothetical protein
MADPIKPDSADHAARTERLRAALKESLAERDNVVLQYGNTMLAWSHVEYWIYIWFRFVTEMPGDRSWRIFYYRKSFRARPEIG